MSSLKRWRGLATLVADAVEHGSRAVERVQKETAHRPFAILEAVPPLALPAWTVHVLHDATVAGVHGTIRGVARLVRATVDAALEAAEAAEAAEAEKAAESANTAEACLARPLESEHSGEEPGMRGNI